MLQKVASSFAPITNPIKLLELSGDNLFLNKGIFECVFNEVLDGGMVNQFRARDSSFFDLKHGCIGKSYLDTNRTLKLLDL